MAGKPSASRFRSMTYRFNGYSFKITGPIRVTAKQKLTVFDVANVMDTLPAALRTLPHGITLLETECTYNKHWEKVTKSANFCAFATASLQAKLITVYNNHDSTDKFAKAFLRECLAHELGHLLDSVAFIYAESGSAGWLDARAADCAYRILHGCKSLTEYVSRYAESFVVNDYKTALCEDFADSVKFYVTSPKNFEANFPNRFQYIKKLIG